jgi:hypothetical protein
MRNLRHRDDDEIATTSDPVPAPVQAQPVPARPQAVPYAPAPAPAAPPLIRAQPLPPIQPAPLPAAPPLTRPQIVAQAVQPQPVRAASTLASVPPPPPPAVGFETSKAQQRPAPPAPAVQSAPIPPPPAAADKPQARQQPAPVARTPRLTEELVADSPLGDWQTDGKNGELVRIEACGTSLCGYAFDPSTLAKGETVLVNMKPKNDTKWTGNVYSRTSGNSYYGIMTLKRDRDTLRVEACALGHFLCSGNTWTRAVSKPDDVVSSQRAQPEPRS